uniref:Myosin motor domain-containing protein n=1 Tax=Anopheles maculatus TaxID=74869 RepID=A0A182S7D8_9DIPT
MEPILARVTSSNLLKIRLHYSTKNVTVKTNLKLFSFATWSTSFYQLQSDKLVSLSITIYRLGRSDCSPDVRRTKFSLTKRFFRQLQTYTGSILIAVNPYKEIDCYTQVSASVSL